MEDQKRTSNWDVEVALGKMGKKATSELYNNTNDCFAQDEYPDQAFTLTIYQEAQKHDWGKEFMDILTPGEAGRPEYNRNPQSYDPLFQLTTEQLDKVVADGEAAHAISEPIYYDDE